MIWIILSAPLIAQVRARRPLRPRVVAIPKPPRCRSHAQTTEVLGGRRHGDHHPIAGEKAARCDGLLSDGSSVARDDVAV